LLVIWLSGYVPWQIPVPGPQVVIQADMVSGQQVQDWVAARLKQREAEERRRAEQARQRLAAQQLAARQQAEARERQQAEARRQAEAERQAIARRAAAELAAKQQAEAAARQAAAKRQAEAEAARRQAEVAAQLAAEQARQQAEQVRQRAVEAARQREMAERERALQAQYAAVQQQAEVARISQLIQQKVARYWLRPPGVTGLTCRVQVRLGVTGSVLSVAVLESSGQHIFDQSVQAAVWKADPLPMPVDETLRADPRFREHIFIFDPAQHL
jgi:colicin import membrane protein